MLYVVCSTICSIKFTILKCTVQWHYSTFTMLYNNCHSSSRASPSLQRKLYLLTPFLLPLVLAATNLLLLSLCICLFWNHMNGITDGLSRSFKARRKDELKFELNLCIIVWKLTIQLWQHSWLEHIYLVKMPIPSLWLLVHRGLRALE